MAYEGGGHGAGYTAAESISQQGRAWVTEETTVGAGAVKLKSRQCLKAQLAIILCLALPWNLTTLAALFGVDSFVSFLVLTPFLAIGLLLCAGVVYSILIQYNPRVEASLDPEAIALGSSSELTWHMTGSAQRISAFKIWVEGRETARYRQGTNTAHAIGVFARITVFETEDTSAMQSGRIPLSIPKFTMHSFKSRHNNIEWYLMMHALIKKWPDTKEQFSIVVLPLQPK